MLFYLIYDIHSHARIEILMINLSYRRRGCQMIMQRFCVALKIFALYVHTRYNSRNYVLECSIVLIDHSNRSGSLEFVVPPADPAVFFPIAVRFTATSLFVSLKVVIPVSQAQEVVSTKAILIGSHLFLSVLFSARRRTAIAWLEIHCKDSASFTFLFLFLDKHRVLMLAGVEISLHIYLYRIY